MFTLEADSDWSEHAQTCLSSLWAAADRSWSVCVYVCVVGISVSKCAVMWVCWHVMHSGKHIHSIVSDGFIWMHKVSWKQQCEVLLSWHKYYCSQPDGTSWHECVCLYVLKNCCLTCLLSCFDTLTPLITILQRFVQLEKSLREAFRSTVLRTSSAFLRSNPKYVRSHYNTS